MGRNGVATGILSAVFLVSTSWAQAPGGTGAGPPGQQTGVRVSDDGVGVGVCSVFDFVNDIIPTKSGSVCTIDTNGTNGATPDTLVRRDGSGNFSAVAITSDLTGNVTCTNCIALPGETTGNYVGTVAAGSSKISVTGADAENATKTVDLGTVNVADLADTSGGKTGSGTVVVSTASASPTSTQVLFFDGNENAAGDAGLTYDSSGDDLTVASQVLAPEVDGGSGATASLLLKGTAHGTPTGAGNDVVIGGASTGVLWDHSASEFTVAGSAKLKANRLSQTSCVGGVTTDSSGDINGCWAPAGSTTELQYRNSGAIGATAGVTWNSGTSTMNMAGVTFSFDSSSTLFTDCGTSDCGITFDQNSSPPSAPGTNQVTIHYKGGELYALPNGGSGNGESMTGERVLTVGFPTLSTCITANDFFGPFGCSTTAANIDWDVTQAITVTKMVCLQVADTSCTLGLTLQNNGSAVSDTTGGLDEECSSVNAAKCSKTGLAAYTAGQGLTVKVTTATGCSATAPVCMIEYHYD